MTNAILDALLVTLADVEAYGGETFDLDAAVKVLENAAAILHDASEEERQLLILRARDSRKTSDAFGAFLLSS